MKKIFIVILFLVHFPLLIHANDTNLQKLKKDCDLNIGKACFLLGKAFSLELEV